MCRSWCKVPKLILQKTLSAPGVKSYTKAIDNPDDDFNLEDFEVESEDSRGRDLAQKKAKGVLSKSVGSAGAKLSPYKAHAYNSLIARANYLSPDRPDISFCVKELARTWLTLMRLIGSDCAG